MVKNLRVLLAFAVVGILALTACSSATATSVETVSAQDASSVLAEDPDAVLRGLDDEHPFSAIYLLADLPDGDPEGTVLVRQLPTGLPAR